MALGSTAPFALAQNVGPANSPPAAKSPAFEVVSIRPSKPGSNWSIRWATTPDGYQAEGESIRTLIMLAYFPQGLAFWSTDRLSGAPKWIDDLYDVHAKVSGADLAEWQKQGIALDQKPMLQKMLQATLAERCHLVVRPVPGGQLPGYSLELGKHGLHITVTKPEEVLPEGVPLGDGGILVPWRQEPRLMFYGVTMSAVARHLSQISRGHPVQDHTGLSGRYDFSVTRIEDPESNMPAGVVSSEDHDPLAHWNIEALGLHLRPIKVPIDNLEIEHIEKPSEN